MSDPRDEADDLAAEDTARRNAFLCASVGDDPSLHVSANGALIAAAPDLLSALERLTAACESSGVERSDIVAARAAIARAEGRP